MEIAKQERLMLQKIAHAIREFQAETGLVPFLQTHETTLEERLSKTTFVNIKVESYRILENPIFEQSYESNLP